MKGKTHEYFAFVIMPFKSEFDDIYNIGIKETAKELNIKAERLDEQMFCEGMIERIYRQIEVADIIVADLSEKNPNVFYELGYAHAKDKICILLTNNIDDIPFDLKQRRHIIYNNSIMELKEQLRKNFDWAINEINSYKDNRIKVELLEPEGYLTTSEYIARANINLKVNLINNSDKKSQEINCIYFYSGNKWDIKQDNINCPFKEERLKGYKYCYFLQTPVKQLSSETWVQLQFSTSRILAKKWEGDEIKSSYQISGYSMLRIVTNDGTFDYDLNINTKVEEVPF